MRAWRSLTTAPSPPRCGIDFPWEYDEKADEPSPGNMDYEPYQEFDSAEETTDWIRSWTGNKELDGDAFRPFGQDGTGGLAVLWLVREGPLTAGPQEAVEFGSDSGVPNAELRAVAEKHSGIGPRTPAEVLAAAWAEFPDFAEKVKSWCR